MVLKTPWGGGYRGLILRFLETYPTLPHWRPPHLHRRPQLTKSQKNETTKNDLKNQTTTIATPILAPQLSRNPNQQQ